MTDCERILMILKRTPGEYVENLYGQAQCIVHSRIADLRRRGHVIDCKRFGPGDFRYRLVGTAHVD